MVQKVYQLVAVEAVFGSALPLLVLLPCCQTFG